MFDSTCPRPALWSRHWIESKNPAAPAVKREAEEDWGLLGPSARSWSSLHSGELLSRPPYPGQTHFRAVHGDQVGHHGDRPDQANRDHDGDSHHPCAHLHPLYAALSLPIGARIFFRRLDVR